ncbi:MAG: hypothetical protein WA208_01545 [Thermoanaerobaculia bacterium]
MKPTPTNSTMLPPPHSGGSPVAAMSSTSVRQSLRLTSFSIEDRKLSTLAILDFVLF